MRSLTSEGHLQFESLNVGTWDIQNEIVNSEIMIQNLSFGSYGLEKPKSNLLESKLVISKLENRRIGYEIRKLEHRKFDVWNIDKSTIRHQISSNLKCGRDTIENRLLGPWVNIKIERSEIQHLKSETRSSSFREVLNLIEPWTISESGESQWNTPGGDQAGRMSERRLYKLSKDPLN